MKTNIQRKRLTSRNHHSDLNIKNVSKQFTSDNNPSFIGKWKNIILLITIPLFLFFITYFISFNIYPSKTVKQTIDHSTSVKILSQQKPQKAQIQQIGITKMLKTSTTTTTTKISLQKNMRNIGNIRDFMNETEQYKDYDIIILYFSSLFGMPPSSSYLRHDIKDYHCNITDNITGQILINQKLLLTDDHSLEKYAAGFVFHGPDCGGFVRSKTNENEIYIYHNMESPAMTSISLTDSNTMKQFDLLMSYQFNSEIFLPYVGRGTIKQLIDTPILYSFEEKTKMGADLAWVGSNCGAHNGRQDYLRDLFKYIPTHSYGACLKSSGDLSWPHGRSLKDLVSKYKFYIVMENSNCKDYITEKLGAAIISSTVPIVFSVNNIPNYDYYLPPHSYINAADFDSAKDLAEYLKKVGSNETLYNEYFKYKINAMKSDELKEIEWQNILKRFKYKETANHWCRAANAIWNNYRNIKVNNIRSHIEADNSCLDKSIMTQYIERTQTKEKITNI